MYTSIGGKELGEMLFCAAASLSEKREAINKLNVFPVPDGDTGTNMSMTLSAADAALRKGVAESVGECAEQIAAAMLRGARGNSGVISSLLFRGMAKSLKGKERADIYDFALAMSDGVDAAYKAVMKPAEGTILTVSRVTANAAVKAAKRADSVETMLENALRHGRTALEQTVEQNPVLKKAGVVDAGGMGYIVIFEAMLLWLRGEYVPAPPEERKDAADFSQIADEDIRFTYCTEFIVSRDVPRSPTLLRSYLQRIGDSLVFVEDEDIIKVHVHTDEPGNVITEALRYGALQTVKVENMRNQHTALTEEADGREEGEVFAPAEKPCGFVTVCAGDGLKELFLSLGADRVVTGGQTMNPSTEDILREVNRTPAETVFVLPNNKNILMAAQQCIPLTEKQVIVVPTTSVPQGIAALAYRDEEADAHALEEAMAEYYGPVRTLLVTYAARDSEFDGHSIRAGEYLALLDGELLDSCNSFEALTELLCRTLAPLEPAVLTVYTGEDAAEEQTAQLEAGFAAAMPDTELSTLSGGQPVYYYMISVE